MQSNYWLPICPLFRYIRTLSYKCMELICKKNKYIARETKWNCMQRLSESTNFYLCNVSNEDDKRKQRNTNVTPSKYKSDGMERRCVKIVIKIDTTLLYITFTHTHTHSFDHRTPQIYLLTDCCEFWILNFTFISCKHVQ